MRHIKEKQFVCEKDEKTVSVFPLPTIGVGNAKIVCVGVPQYSQIHLKYCVYSLANERDSNMPVNDCQFLSVGCIGN